MILLMQVIYMNTFVSVKTSTQINLNRTGLTEYKCKFLYTRFQINKIKKSDLNNFFKS